MKVSIVGGGGRVGSTAAFSLLSNRLASELVLIDIDEEAVEGEALDLSHSLSGIKLESSVYGGSDYSLTRNSDLILITAGIARKPGMTRLELANANIKIVKDVVSRAMEHSSNPFIFIVSNPVDVLTHYALEVSRLEPSRVFGLGTMLDTIRLKSLLKQRLNIGYREEVMIIGEHGDSMTPVFSKLNAGYPREKLWKVFQEVREGAAKVIEAKGGTWFAPAVAISQVVRNLTHKQREILPVSAYLEEHGVHIGFPSEIGTGGVKPIEFALNEEEEALFLKSVQVIKGALNR